MRSIRPPGQRRAAFFARAPWLIPILITLPALIPLLKPGFFVSDDGLFHVYRIAALADAWQHGVLYPRLFPEFGFGYGQAVLNFYAPLSYVPGALLSLIGFSPATTMELSMALGFFLAGLAAYGMGKALWGVAGGIVSTVVYTYFPYHLADAYLRGALPEHMAFIFPPLIVWATVAAFREEHPVPSYLWAALAWAGLVYTHNLTVLLMAPAWGILVLVLGVTTGRWRRLAGAAGAALLGAGLSAWLWLPFLAESKLVGIGLGPSAGGEQHLAPLEQLIQTLLAYQYRIAHGAGLAEHPLSWPAALLFLIVLGWLIWNALRRRALPGFGLAGFGLALAAGAAFMTATPAQPLWRALMPVLGQLQYPWRFMTLVALGLTVAAGALFAGRRPASAPRYALAAFGVLIALAFIVGGLARVPAQPLQISAAEASGTARMWAEDAANGQVGATWTGEFLPQTVMEQRWALGRGLEGARDGAPLAPAPRITLTSMGYQQLTLSFEGAAPPRVLLHQFHLPAWQAWVDGEPRPTYPSGELGLVTLDLPTAARTAAFRFGPTRAAMAAGLIVLVSALGWSLLALNHRWRARRRDRLGLTSAAPLLLLTVGVVLANGFGIGVKTWTPQAVQATVGDVAQLVGYDVQPAKGEQALDVTLYWFALRETSANFKVFVHLLAPDGQVLTQHDGDPVGGYTPTTRWKQGELIADTHRVALPDSVAPGQYQMRAGMYEIRPGASPAVRNLDVTPPTEDRRVVLGSVSVP